MGTGELKGTLGGTERNGGSLTKNNRPGIRDRMSGFLGRFGGFYLHFFSFSAEMTEVCTLVRGLQLEGV